MIKPLYSVKSLTKDFTHTHCVLTNQPLTHLDTTVQLLAGFTLTDTSANGGFLFFASSAAHTALVFTLNLIISINYWTAG